MNQSILRCVKWPYKRRVDAAHAWGVVAVGTAGLVAIPTILATLHATDSHFRWWWPTTWMVLPAAIFLVGLGLTVLPVMRPLNFPQVARNAFQATTTEDSSSAVIGRTEALVSDRVGDANTIRDHDAVDGELLKAAQPRQPTPPRGRGYTIHTVLPTEHAFISYVREDDNQVDRLQRDLEAAGVSVWRDTADLWPGQDWRTQIREAITRDSLVFLACFSRASITQAKSRQNEELVLAIDELRQRRPDTPWLIPVRFDDCQIPDRDIGGGRTLTSLQSADLFGDHYHQDSQRLIQAIQRILEIHPTTPIGPLSAEDGRLAPEAAIGKPDPWSLLIDELILRLDLENWDYHVGGLMRSSTGMHSSSKARLLALAIWLNGRILLDDQLELRRILSTLLNVIGDLIDTFDQHCEEVNPDQDDPWFRTAKFYKIGGWSSNRTAEVELYEAHINLLSDLALELTRVVNWLCDFVRREFNPMFRFEQGAIQVEGGPFQGADTRWFRPEYSSDDLSRPGGPYGSLEDFKTERFSRDFHTGVRREKEK